MFQDQISDVFVCINIHNEYDIMNEPNKKILMILFILGVIFIVLPSIISTIQLMYEINKHFIADDNVGILMRSWLTEYSQIMYLFALIFGSAHASISILNVIFIIYIHIYIYCNIE